MRRHALLAFAVVAASACADATSPSSPAMPPEASVSGAAIAINQSFREALDQTEFVACANGGAGEEVQLSGTLHTVFHLTINANRLMIREHFQPQGAIATGLTTGTVYRAVGGTRTIETVSAFNGSFTGTLVNNFRLIGPGPGNNLQIHENAHLTVNANGEITADFFHDKVDCG